MKIKILTISHMWPVPYDKLNGIVVYKQTKELLNQGYDIKVISPIAWTPFPVKYINSKWKAYSDVPERTVYDSIEVFHPRYLSFPKALFMSSSGYRMYYGVKKLVRELHNLFPFDLIHAHMALPDGYAGMLLSQDYNVP
ncbi:TPA: glycosyltransferase family 4 protein, partial [Candidatus Poribacteria bacterium]|nr:glycosyltransferase family 4 protein [Candidatus Poribacteria bacterium]